MSDQNVVQPDSGITPPNAGMSPVISPDGELGHIPRQNLGTALQRGFKTATYVTSPEGSPGLIPTENVGKAIKQGFKVGQPAVANAQQPSKLADAWRGFRLGAGSSAGFAETDHPIWDAIKGMMTPNPENAAVQLPGGNTPAPIQNLIGGAVRASSDQFQKAQQAAQSNNESLPHALAPLIPVLGPAIAAYRAARGQQPNVPAMTHAVAGALPVVGPMAENAGEQMGNAVTGPKGETLPPSQWDYEQLGHGAGQAAGTLGTEALGTEKGQALTDAAISKVGGGVQKAAVATASKTADLAGAARDAFNSGFRPESLDAAQSITKAVKPRNSIGNWKQAVETALPDARRAADTAGIEVKTLPDALQAVTQAKKDIWSEYQSHLDPNTQVTVDGTPVADAMESAINQRFEAQNPQAAKNIRAIASTYRRPMTLGEVEDFLQDANNDLKSYYAQHKVGQRAAALDPQKGYVVNEAGALRSLLNDSLDNITGGDAAALKQRYGNLSTLQDVLERRINVADRAAPNSLIEQMGKVRAAGKIAKGVVKLPFSPMGGIADIGEGAYNLAAARAAAKGNSADFLTSQAFNKTTPTPAARPYQPVEQIYQNEPGSPSPQFSGPPAPGLPAASDTALPPGQYNSPATASPAPGWTPRGFLPDKSSTGMQSVPTDIQGTVPIPKFLQKALPAQRQIQVGPSSVPHESVPAPNPNPMGVLGQVPGIKTPHKQVAVTTEGMPVVKMEPQAISESSKAPVGMSETPAPETTEPSSSAGAQPVRELKVGDVAYRSHFAPEGTEKNGNYDAVIVEAYRGDKKIGHVEMGIDWNGEGKNHATSGGLLVPEAERGKGVARQMYENLPEIAKQYGIDTIQAEGVQTEGGKGVWASLARDGKAHKSTDAYGNEVYKMGGAGAQPEKPPTPEAEAPVIRQPAVDLSKKPVALPQGEIIQGAYGSDTHVKTPTGSIPASYKLVEADSLIPSHNSETFAKNPDYPEGVQERAYHTSKEAQNRVIQQGQNYDPAYTVNTNPDAVNGPPIVTQGGTVLGGNSRAMSTQRIYARNAGDPYKAAIKSQAGQFGIDPATVDNFQKPVLVREIESPETVDQARQLATDLNKNMTGALGVSEKAVSAGKAISPDTFNTIASMLQEPESTLRTAMAANGKEFMRMLTRDGVITERERPQFVDTSTGGLSEEGKTFVERALRGAIVDDPVLMDQTPKSVLNKLDGALADLVPLGQRTDEYNLLPVLRQALAEHGEIARRGLSVPEYYGAFKDKNFGAVQQDALLPTNATNPAVKAVVELLGKKSSDVRSVIHKYAQDAKFDQQGQGSMLIAGEQPSAANAFNSAFGTKLTEDEFQQSLIDTIDKQLQNRNGVQDVGSTQKETRGNADEVQRQQPETAKDKAATGTTNSIPASQLTPGDTFVDDTGEPRRVVSIDGNKIKTQDGDVRNYTGAVELKGDLNSPRALLAQGGKRKAVGPMGDLLPGFGNVPAERAAANAVAEGERLTTEVGQRKGDISSAAGKMERESPLFAGSGAGGNQGLFDSHPIFSAVGKSQPRTFESLLPAAQDFIAQHATTYEQALPEMKDVLSPHGEFSSRLKDPSSLAKTMLKRDKGFGDVHDAMGYRVTTPSMAQVPQALEDLKAKYGGNVLEVDNKIEKPGLFGYRGIHADVDIGGKRAEVQIRTKNQSNFGEWCHEVAWKGDWGKDPVVKSYAEKLSDALFKIDSGEPAAIPPAPAILRQNGAAFDIHKTYLPGWLGGAH